MDKQKRETERKCSVRKSLDKPQVSSHTLMHTTNTHTVLECECRLSPRARWLTVLFFRSSKHRLWADAITSAPSTCQVPLPALMVAVERAGGWLGGRGWTLDAILDPVPASVCQACITVHFPASSLLCCAQPSLSAGVSLQKSSAITQGCSLLRSDWNGKQWSPPYN